MEGAYLVRLADPDMRVCRDCPSHCQCAVLDTCLHVLESVNAFGSPTESLRFERGLRNRIHNLGYDFPCGKKRCALADHPGDVSELIEEALQVLQLRVRSPVAE